MNPQTWWFRGLEAAQVAIAADPERPAAAAAAAAEAVGATSPERAARACSAGCAACCHLPVGVTGAEAVRLAAALPEELGSDVGRARLMATAAEVEAVSWQQQAVDRRRCVLLGDDARCRAYEARPIACRGWHSTSREACDRDHAGEAVAVTPDRPAFVAAMGAHEALRRAAGGETGGAGETYELTSALARCVDGRGLAAAKRR